MEIVADKNERSVHIQYSHFLKHVFDLQLVKSTNTESTDREDQQYLLSINLNFLVYKLIHSVIIRRGRACSG